MERNEAGLIGDTEGPWGGSPFREVSDPARRAWLEVYSLTGVKSRADAAVGMSQGISRTPAWKADPEFQEWLPLAEELAAELLVEEARRRAVEGVQAHRFTKMGDPIFHPTLCRCGHEDDRHDGGRAGHLHDPDDTGGPCLECSCEGFRRAPYVEHAYSDRLLETLLKAKHPDFRDRLEVRGLMGKLDFGQLPPAAIERIAGGEHPLAVLAQLAEERKAIAPPVGELVQEEPPEL